MSKKVLINCSNLHVGGGVAVATSFINAISCHKIADISISLLLSPTVKKNLDSLQTNFLNFDKVIVKEYYGIDALWQGLDSNFKNFDLIFTVFGPAYFLFSRTKHIIGFAQPSIIYPLNPITKKLRLIDKLKHKVKYRIQELFFYRGDEIIVELGHVKKQLKKKWLFRGKNIHIVNSAVDSIYRNPSRWRKINFQKDDKIKIGIISRNYPHKNLSCLPQIKQTLDCKYNIYVNFYVTFTQEEWSECSEIFRREIVNIGSLLITQCPSFYSYMDGIIFPSLLECFSAVPIESMMMKKPLFASDLPFIRDCCSQHANYFNPLDIESIAKSIAVFYSLPNTTREKKLLDAYEFVLKYPDAQSRAKNYIRLIQDSLEI